MIIRISHIEVILTNRANRALEQGDGERTDDDTSGSRQVTTRREADSNGKQHEGKQRRPKLGSRGRLWQRRSWRCSRWPSLLRPHSRAPGIGPGAALVGRVHEGHDPSRTSTMLLLCSLAGDRVQFHTRGWRQARQMQR